MTRIALGVEYDGSHFNGWQRQSHDAVTVQQAVEEALGRVADHPVAVICAGRTDAGVHATGQVIHFDSDAPRSEEAWVRGSNSHLPKAVAILWARPVADDFHARFAACRRSYRYIILNRAIRPTYLQKRVTHDYRPLDEARMAEAGSHLLGRHDFTSYRTVACQAKSPVRTLHRLEVWRHDELVFLEVEADGFLHHMVRNIAGVLAVVGAGEREPVWAREVLEARDRTAGGVTAPPHGLYLTGVAYPEEFDLPRLSRAPVVW